MNRVFALALTGMLGWAGVALPACAGGFRQIDITLDDTLKIRPDRITAKAGETVEFVVRNSGKLAHEFVIGSAKEVDEHAAEMREMKGMSMQGMQMPGMESEGAAPHQEPRLGQVDVEPGRTAHLRYRFRQAGELAFACLYPGHREAGMKGIASVK